MLELYGLEDGSVYDVCACNPGDEYINLTLPARCYSPSESDCTWYNDCLEKRYPCSGTKDNYAMKYATKFCNLYSENYKGFSDDGKQWIDAVRKCLQVSLVDILRPYLSMSCDEIKKKAFDSHAPCYETPDKTSPQISICNLGPMDFWRVFWTIKSSLVLSFESSMEAIKGFWDISKTCASNIIEHYSYDSSMRNVRLTVNYESASNPMPSVYSYEWGKRLSYISEEMANSIADKLNWNTQGVLWFANADTSSTEYLNSKIFVNIFIADRKTFDLNGSSSRASNFTTIINEFQSNVENGELAIDKTDFSFSVLAAKGCSDANCGRMLFDVISKSKQTDTHKENNNMERYLIVGICSGAFLVLLSLGLSICFSHWKHGFGKGVV